MPLDPAELRRGRIVWAIYPFASKFPAETIEDDNRQKFATVDEYAVRYRGDPTELIIEVRLRPVLLLHDGTRGDHDDVLCLRINSVKPKHKQSGSWGKVENHEHPFLFHLPTTGPAGLKEESVIDLNSVGTLHKSAIAKIKPPGALNQHEMQIISERLQKVLQLELAPYIAAQAKRLIKRASQANPGQGP